MSELEEEYRLDYFEAEGFHRLECVECGDHFWTRDPDRETCGEPPCAEYGSRVQKWSPHSTHSSRWNPSASK